jgi:type II secretory pathway component PulK
MLSFNHSRKSRRGSILIVVLALIFFMSIAMLAMLREATDVMVKEGSPHLQETLRREAYQGTEMLMALLSEFIMIDGALYHPGQGWGKPTELIPWTPGDGVTVHYRVEDLSGKFPLSRLVADPLWWDFFFTEWDLPLGEWARLRDSLLDWMDEDDETRPSGAEDTVYLSRNPPYRPPNRPLQSWQELRLIQGAEDALFEEDGSPNEIFNRIREDISLRHEGAVNINTASERVILAIARRGNQDGPAMVRRLSGLDGERGTEEDELITDVSTLNWPSSLQDILSARAERLLLEVEARRGEGRFMVSLEVLITQANGNQSPFRIVRRRENFSE